MLDWTGLGLLAALGALIGVWQASLAAREAALAAAARSCASSGAQLLDQALVIGDLGLRRDAQGRLRVWRLYDFEFSVDGQARHAGRVGMLGAQVEFVQLDGPDGTVIEGGGRLL